MRAKCPACGAAIDLSTAKAGSTVQCFCGKRFRLKVPATSPAAPTAQYKPAQPQAPSIAPQPEQAGQHAKVTLGVVLGWIFGVFFALGGLGALGSGDVVPGLCVLVVGLVLLPPVGKLVAKKSRRHITAAHKTAVIVLCFVGAALTMPKELHTLSAKQDPSGSRSQQAVDKPRTPGDGAPAAKKPGESQGPSEARLKDAIAVGDFVYRADQIRFEKTLGNQFMKKTANGIYLLVGVGVMNRSKETRTLDASMFQILDALGNRYDYSIDGATMLMAMENIEPLLLKQCQSNIATSGVLVFEVPRESDEYILTVTGGLWSGQKGQVRLAEKPTGP